MEEIMKMSSLGNKRLKKYSKFLENIHLKHKGLLHLGTTTMRYFYFAELQIVNFENNLQIFFDIDNNVDYSEACYSNAFSFYTLIRVSLEASRRLSDEIQKQDNRDTLKKFRSDNEKVIINIIKIANDIVKHPLEDAKRNKIVFYEPGGLDISGNVDIYEWSTKDSTDVKTFDIDPIYHCDQIFEYLEKLSVVYLEALK